MSAGDTVDAAGVDSDGDLEEFDFDVEEAMHWQEDAQLASLQPHTDVSEPALAQEGVVVAHTGESLGHADSLEKYGTSSSQSKAAVRAETLDGVEQSSGSFEDDMDQLQSAMEGVMSSMMGMQSYESFLGMFSHLTAGEAAKEFDLEAEIRADLDAAMDILNTNTEAQESVRKAAAEQLEQFEASLSRQKAKERRLKELLSDQPFVGGSEEGTEAGASSTSAPAYYKPMHMKSTGSGHEEGVEELELGRGMTTVLGFSEFSSSAAVDTYLDSNVDEEDGMWEDMYSGGSSSGVGSSKAGVGSDDSTSITVVGHDGQISQVEREEEVLVTADVEDFEYDAEFDYDNIDASTLTPKFGPQSEEAQEAFRRFKGKEAAE